MKQQVNAFLALLFMISIFTTSLHELLPHHHSSDCQVCTLVEHQSALVPEKTSLVHLEVPVYEPLLPLQNQHSYVPNSTHGPRAPPLFS